MTPTAPYDYLAQTYYKLETTTTTTITAAATERFGFQQSLALDHCLDREDLGIPSSS